MDVKYELLANTLSKIVRQKIEDAFNDLKYWTEANAMVMLFEIREIIEDKSLSDSDTIKKITEVYKRHNVDCHMQHI